MTTLLKNASYLKVSHSGQTTGSLLLADLADEENAKQEKKIPVYVPENGSITLPLDEDVLLSYQQGTIRGLEDQGYVSTELLGTREPAEIWVATDGDDTNPGTREAPYASIQKAIDDLHAEYGHDTPKVVHVKAGQYGDIGNAIDAIVINTRNIRITGPKESTRSVGPVGRAVIVTSDSLGGFIVTDMTRAGLEALEADGGLSFSISSGQVTTSHATISGREAVDGYSDEDEANVILENIEIVNFDAPATTLVNDNECSLTAVFTNTDGYSGLQLNNVTLLAQDGIGSFYEAQAYIRSMTRVSLFDSGPSTSNITGQKNGFFFDQCRGIRWHASTSPGALFVYYDSTDADSPSADPIDVFKENQLFAEFTYVLVDVNVTGSAEDPTLRYLNVDTELQVGGDLLLENSVVPDITGAGNLTMNGGGYTGTNSLGGTFTYNALGTT